MTRKVTPTTTAKIESQDRTPSTQKQSPNRFKFPQRKKPTLYPTTTPLDEDYTEDGLDQTIESSNQQSLEEEVGQSIETTELSDIAAALQVIQRAPFRPKTQSRVTYKTTLNRNPPTSKTRATTPLPRISTTTRFVLKKPKPNAFDKIQNGNAYRPQTDYDYYDEGDTRIVSKIPKHSKVLIHSDGTIECLDQGNFPHPLSCKKFISCNKMYNNNVVGFEYTCPSYLSFDPVGGMCNWAAGLGCEDLINV